MDMACTCTVIIFLADVKHGRYYKALTTFYISIVQSVCDVTQVQIECYFFLCKGSLSGVFVYHTIDACLVCNFKAGVSPARTNFVSIMAPDFMSMMVPNFMSLVVPLVDLSHF